MHVRSSDVRAAGSGALALAAMAATGLGAPAAHAAALTPSSSAAPCYNVVRREGITTHLEAWYSCGPLAVYHVGAWLTRPLGPAETGHFQLTHGLALIANSGETHWQVNQPFVWNGTLTSPRGELICVSFWIANPNGSHRRFGPPTCVTR